jgi:hypothetical protein
MRAVSRLNADATLPAACQYAALRAAEEQTNHARDCDACVPITSSKPDC